MLFTTLICMNSLDIKSPDTVYHLHPLISRRWSPRAFSDQDIPESQILELLEAARWSASSSNEQPWEYAYALRGTEGFDQIWGTLKPGNQPWSGNAAVLIVAMARQTFRHNGAPNPWARHDLGLANAQLVLQAAHRDIYAHMMAGFFPEKLIRLLDLNEDVSPVCVIALGYLDDPESLDEPFRSRELAPRVRQPLESFVRKVQ